MSTEQTAALLLPTLSWSWDDDWEAIKTRPSDARRDVAFEAMRWQEVSTHASAAEMAAYPSPFRRVERRNGVENVTEAGQGVPPREQNRILEIHGLMGAIGEQLGLAWTAEQDGQRIVLTAGR